MIGIWKIGFLRPMIGFVRGPPMMWNGWTGADADDEFVDEMLLVATGDADASEGGGRAVVDLGRRRQQMRQRFADGIWHTMRPRRQDGPIDDDASMEQML